MKAYFLNIPNEERQNILNQHKHVYDGYTTNYANSSEQPLFVQDFANDKGGITVNNKGEVKKYTNLNINEEIDEMQLDTIGDGPMDMEAGVFDEEISEDEIPTEDQDEKEPFEIDVDFYDELGDEQMNENVKSQISESLKWFKKFTKYN